MPHRTERLSLAHTELRVAKGDDGQRSISGLIPYNSRSVDLGGFTEQIAPGAFAQALQPDADVLALRDHDSRALLGRTKSGTLKLVDSPEGLRYTIKLPNTSAANDLAESIDRGDLDSTSFGFSVPKDGDTWDASKTEISRTLRSIHLMEVSPCSFPAYPDAVVSVRSAPRDIQERLADPEKRIADDAALGVDTDCTCECPECVAGHCDSCSDVDCDCAGCDCTSAQGNTADDPDGEERNRMHMALSLRMRL